MSAVGAVEKGTGSAGAVGCAGCAGKLAVAGRNPAWLTTDRPPEGRLDGNRTAHRLLPQRQSVLLIAAVR